MIKLLKRIGAWSGIAKPNPVIPKPVQDATGDGVRLKFDQEGGNALHWTTRMRWGIVGMNGQPFVHTSPTAPEAPRLWERFQGIPRIGLHHGQQRELAPALGLAMKLLAERPAQRNGIVYITAGPPSSSEENLAAVIEQAADAGVSVHGIYLGNDPEAEAVLGDVCTQRYLRFGGFHTATDTAGLIAAVSESMRGLIPPSWVKRFNRTVFIVDFTEAMAGPLGEQTRIEACATALTTLVMPWHQDEHEQHDASAAEVWKPRPRVA